MRPFYENRLYPSDIPLMIARLDNLAFLAHWHWEVELLYVSAGSIRVGVNKECRLLFPGELAICGSGDIHYYDGKGLQSRTILVLFRPALIGYLNGWPEKGRFVSPFIDNRLWREINGGWMIRERIKELLGALERENAGQARCYDLFVKSFLIELCAIALRHFPAAAAEARPGQERPRNLQTMQEALQFLDQHYMEDLTLDQVARHLNLSSCHFSRLFNQISGMNFKAFLNSIRIGKAEQQIQNSSRPLIDIAYECGFNSVRTFNRAFQTLKGYPPSKLRY